MGVFAKFAGAITSIPKPVLGGMTSFLFCLVAISGIKIISTTEFTRRDRFVLTAAVLPGLELQCFLIGLNTFSLIKVVINL